MDRSWQTLWKYALPKERNVLARVPVFWRDQILGVFTYDRKNFIESAVIALSRDDGRELWRQNIAHVATEPVIDANGTIFVASFAGAIHAYAPDGQALWTSAFGNNNVTPPILSDGRLFLAETGGRASKTWCLDASDGQVIWSAENGGHSYRLCAAGDRIFHATVVSGQQFGQSTIHLHCLDQQTGETAWSVEVDQYHFNVMMAGDLLLWGARNALNAYDPATGALVTRLAIPDGTAISSGPVLANGTIIAADDSGIIRAIALEQKGLLFKKPALRDCWFRSLPDSFAGHPLVMGDYVYLLTEQGEVHCYDLTGKAIGPSLTIEGGKGGGLAAAGDTIAISQGRVLELYRR